MPTHEKLVDRQSVSPVFGRMTRFLVKLPLFLKLGKSTHLIAILDQMVVSGTSFVMTVAIGRWTNAPTLGIYAIAMSVVAAALALQDALIIKPFTIQRFSSTSPKTEHAGSSLLLSLALGLLLGFLALMVGLGSYLASEKSSPMIAVAVACLIPFALVREFARKIAMANMQIVSALVLDIASSCISLLILTALALSNRISPAAVCFGAAAVSCVITMSWYRFTHSGFNYSRKSLAATASQDWQLGKWLFVGQFAREIQQSAPYWIILFISGAASTGLYAACMSIIAFANPVIFGIANILTPKAVVAWNESGGEGLRKQCYRDATFLGTLMAVFCAGVALFGTSVIKLLYHGSDFSGSAQMLIILSLGMTATTISLPASTALATMERPRAIVVTGGVSAVLSVVFVLAFMMMWGTIGAAYGFFFGNFLSALGRWVAFLKIVPPAGNTKEVLNVLRASVHLDGQAKVNVHRIGEGDDAVVYAVDGDNKDISPEGKLSLIVKLFKNKPGIDEAAMRAQFQALTRLHNTIGHSQQDGWTVETPQPLHASASPLAIVMTLAPGHNIQMASKDLDEKLAAQWVQIADVCMGGLTKLWANDQVHGDFGLQNLLVDFTQHKLFLIDPGTVDSCSICSQRRSGSPAALDLGHLLADYAMDASDISGNIASGNRRQILTERLLEVAFLNRKSVAERRKLLADLETSFKAHVADKLEHAGTLRRPWLKWITGNGNKRVADMLKQLSSGG